MVLLSCLFLWFLAMSLTRPLPALPFCLLRSIYALSCCPCKTWPSWTWGVMYPMTLSRLISSKLQGILLNENLPPWLLWLLWLQVFHLLALSHHAVIHVINMGQEVDPDTTACAFKFVDPLLVFHKSTLVFSDQPMDSASSSSHVQWRVSSKAYWSPWESFHWLQLDLNWTLSPQT